MKSYSIALIPGNGIGHDVFDHLGEKNAAGRLMEALEVTTAGGIGTTPGKDRTEAITAAVLETLI